MLSRRGALGGGFCLCCSSPRARAADAPLAMIEVAPGLFFRRGIDADAAPGNDDAIANCGFVVGREAVAVVDPGGGLADGRALRDAVRAVTRLPIRYVVLTHVHPDHIFGAAAFAEDRPSVIGHARLPSALAQRGEFYRRNLDQLLGTGQAGSVPVPDMLVDHVSHVDLGSRVLVLQAWAPAHTEADLTVFDEATATIMSGDLVFIERMPSLDGNLRGWLRVLADLRELPAKWLVPGHGRLGAPWPDAAADVERYLGALLRDTLAAIAAGTPMEVAARTVAANERGRWALFDDYNGRNALEAYSALQWE